MISFSTFQNRYQKQPNNVLFSLSSFVQGMTTPVSRGVTEKNKLPLWSPTTFKGNRSKVNADMVSCLVFDVDDGESEFEQYKLFHMWHLIAHTSFSHTPEHPKYRIIIPLEHPIPASEWEKAWRRALEVWSFVGCAGFPDMKALKDPARMYYRYALPINGSEHHQAVAVEGMHTLALDWQQVKLPKKPEPKKFDRNKEMTVSEYLLETHVRETIAQKANATISGNRAYNIICPTCNRPDAYFFIDIQSHPNPMKGWQCNHKKSCGGYGNLADLL